MKVTIEQDPEGLGPDLEITTEMDEHEGHAVEVSEILRDNAIEWTRWGHCMTCDKEVKMHSQTWADFDSWLAAQKEE